MRRRRKLRSISLAILVCISFVINGAIVCVNISKNDIILVNSDFTTIQGFSNFELMINNSEINSYQSNESIYFNYFATTEDTGLEEYYILDLNMIGSISHYEIKLIMNYTNFELNNTFQFGIGLGSYFTEEGDFYGNASISDFYLIISSIFDNYEDKLAQYQMVGPPSIEFLNGSSPGYNVSTYDDLEFKLIRNSTGSYYEILHYKNQTIALSSYIDTDNPYYEIDLPLNFIVIGYESGTLESNNMHCNCYDFYANLTIAKPGPIIKSNISFTVNGYSTTFAVATILFCTVIAIGYRRRRRIKEYS